MLISLIRIYTKIALGQLWGSAWCFSFLLFCQGFVQKKKTKKQILSSDICEFTVSCCFRCVSTGMNFQQHMRCWFIGRQQSCLHHKHFYSLFYVIVIVFPFVPVPQWRHLLSLFHFMVQSHQIPLWKKIRCNKSCFSHKRRIKWTHKKFNFLTEISFRQHPKRSCWWHVTQ